MYEIPTSAVALHQVNNMQAINQYTRLLARHKRWKGDEAKQHFTEQNTELNGKVNGNLV